MSGNRLWPYGDLAALLAMPVVWLVAIVVVSVTQRLADWPPPAAGRVVLWVTLAVSVIPLVLRLIDGLRARWGGQGLLDDQGWSIGQIRLNRANFDDMAARASDPHTIDVPATLARFDALLARAAETRDGDELTRW